MSAENDNDMLRRHDKDLYRGDGRKPGITTRVEVLETDLETMKVSVEEIKDTQKNTRNLIFGVIAGIVTQTAIYFLTRH